MRYTSLMFRERNSGHLLRACLFLIAPAVLVLAGCGGSGGDSTEPPLTKAQYIKQADAICNKVYEKQLSALAVYGKKHPKPRPTRSPQAAAIVAAALPPTKVGIEEIKSLNRPAADKQAIDSMLDEIDAAIKETEEHPTMLVAGVKNPFEKVNQRAAKYGFEACSQLP
jgi:hypothetical protein